MEMAYWYRATTLSERAARLPEGSGAASMSSGGEEARKKLQRWKEQVPFNRGSFFAERLAMDNITEEDLFALLVEPIKAVQSRLCQPTPPDWLIKLREALTAASTGIASLVPEMEGGDETYAFLRPFFPLLHNGIERFQARVEQLVQQQNRLPFDPRTILSLLLPNLVRQISPKVSRTLVLELHIARLRGRLRGETSQERFQNYLELLCQRENLWPFLEEYCVLARQILTTANLWVDCSLEFLSRLCQDWEEILALYTPERNPGVLIEAVGGAGDTHRGGHSVIILTFQAGFQLVYKPRSLAIDVHFQEVLAWLNERGSQLAFLPIKVIDRGCYGWSEFIVTAECRSEAEVARFYKRQGGYLALLYALEACDFHAENILAAGEHPVLVDLEALFHPRAEQSNLPGSERPAFNVMEHSVLRSALLPQRFWVNRDFESVDMSGLGSSRGQLSPLPLPKWDGIGTDEMKLVRERIVLRGSKNCPQIDGHEARASDYIESIVSGFSSIYRLLMDYREDFCAQCLPRFAHDEVRFVARNTRTYATLLYESFHPNMLRDALKRERFLDSLWIEVEQRPYLARLVAAERADLLRGDIPMFTTRVESRNLLSSQGECMQDFFAESSMEVVRQRIQRLDERDLRRQIWMIQASFSSLAQPDAASKEPIPVRLPASPPPASTRSAQPPSKTSLSEGRGNLHRAAVSRKRCLAAACAIGDRLSAQALRHADSVDWLGLALLKEGEWGIAPAGLDLHSGLPGILLFLSHLGAITGDAHYTELAQSALKTLHAELTRVEHFPSRVGAFMGLGSCIYLFVQLAALWDEPLLLQKAEEIVERYPALIEKDDVFDLMSGSAGGIAVLLSLYAAAPSARTLEVTIQCGEHLLAHVRPMSQGTCWKTPSKEVHLASFGQGAVGIAWSLLRLAEVSEEERFRSAALTILDYERRFYTAEGENRQDHRAAGLALGRLALLPYMENDAAIRREVKIALKAMQVKGLGCHNAHIGPNHSLYHGDAGKLEVLLLARQLLKEEQYQEMLEKIYIHLLENVEMERWITGTPCHIETPGLMVGLAGIGYELLRLAEPARVPPVLMLSIPGH